MARKILTKHRLRVPLHVTPRQTTNKVCTHLIFRYKIQAVFQTFETILFIFKTQGSESCLRVRKKNDHVEAQNEKFTSSTLDAI